MCLICKNEHNIGRCEHLGASASLQETMPMTSKQIQQAFTQSIQPEVAVEPRRKPRDRKRVWYPCDFKKELGHRRK